MYMKKLNLYEELNRMKGLMTYTNGDINKNILQEGVNDHCTGNNSIDEVLIKSVRQSEKYPTNYSFYIKAHFGAAKSSSDVYKDVLTNLKSQVLDVMPKNQKEALNDGRMELSIIKIKHIWSSASNYLNGPLIPTNWNNRSKISGGYEGTVPNIKTPINDSSDTNWKKNEGYAKSRSTNLFNWIKKSGNKMGINVDPKLVEVTPKIMIMDTGGCTDETRDISKYKNPGQWLSIQGTIRLKRKPIPVPTTEEMLKCLQGLKIMVGYFKAAESIKGVGEIPKNPKSHRCDYAIFDVFANGVPIGVSNMNNGEKYMSGSNTAKQYTSVPNQVYKAPTEAGDTTYTVITVSPKKIKEIVGKSAKGEVKLTMKANANNVTRSAGTVHGDAPMVLAVTTKTIKGKSKKDIVYGPKAPNTGNEGTIPFSKELKIGIFRACS